MKENKTNIYIRERREELGLSVCEMAERACFSESMWYKFEQGSRNILPEHVEHAAGALCMPKAFLAADLWPDMAPGMYRWKDPVMECCSQMASLEKSYGDGYWRLFEGDSSLLFTDRGSGLHGSVWKEFRRRAGISRIQAGLCAGVPATVIDNYENGVYDRILDYICIQACCYCFNVAGKGYDMIFQDITRKRRLILHLVGSNALRALAWINENGKGITPDGHLCDGEEVYEFVWEVNNAVWSEPNLCSSYTIWTDEKLEIVRQIVRSREKLLPYDADRFLDDIYIASVAGLY